MTIQNLIGAGMDPKTENNPYLGFIYTSFQERATKISHGATARHASELCRCFPGNLLWAAGVLPLGVPASSGHRNQYMLWKVGILCTSARQKLLLTSLA